MKNYFEFDDVSVARGHGDDRVTVLDRVTIDLPVDGILAILSPRGGGKTTLAALLAGLAVPDAGEIIAPPGVSFPIGFSGGFHNQLTVRQNLSHAARLYEADPDEVCAFVEQCLETAEILDLPWGLLQGPQRAMTGFAFGYAIPFETYIFDNTVAIGDEAFRKLCFALFEQRMENANAVLLVRDVRAARRFATMGALLHQGQLVVCDSFDEAAEAYDAIEN